MENINPLSPELLALLRSVDTCAISNAIETLNVRMRDDGYIQYPLKCLIPSLPPIAGHAVTGRIRTGAPPISSLCYYQRTDWWDYMAQFPSPKIMVLADVGRSPGGAAFVGEIHAEISRALGCVGYVSNGAIRDLPALERIGFQCFSGGVSPSTASAILSISESPSRSAASKSHREMFFRATFTVSSPFLAASTHNSSTRCGKYKSTKTN